jgi:sorting nexin-1/2
MMSNNTYSAVLRRYSDFLWLYERLHVERAGAIVPPIPEKQPVGRFSPAFVEDRRVHLERFLRRVAVHPELADAPCLDTFLRADDVTFHAAKHAKGQVMMSASQANIMSQSSPPKKEGIKRWFAEAKTSMTGDLVRSPDDDLFDEIHRYVHGLDNQMRNVSHQASGLVRKGKEIANGLFEFGLAFNLLGQSEADALGDALGKMGETADCLSVLSAEHAEKEMAQFEEPLQDYIKVIHAVKLALQRRHEKRLSYSTCLAEVEAKQSQLGKLRLQIGSEAKAYAAEMSLRRAQEAADVARDDFATVSQRVLREVDRFKREKAEDMRRTVLDYINLQVDYNKRMEEVWGTLIPQLERVQLDSNSNAIPVTPEQQQQYAASGVAGMSTQPPMMQQQQQPPFNSDEPMPSAPSPPVPTPTTVPVVGDPSSMISVQYRE